MPSLKDVVRRAHGMKATVDLPTDHEDKVHPAYVIPAHDAWMSRPENERGWSPEALDFAAKALGGAFKHPRDHRISPSALGDHCERLLLFGYAGAPKLPFPKANAEKMAAGEFHHLRWQMEGISAGYMLPPPGQDYAGEVWVHSSALRCGGSADARLADGSLFELKSTAEHLFKALRDQRGSALDYVMGMHRKHKLQMEAYWLADETGAAERKAERLFTDWGSLVYQNAGNPTEILEFRLHSAPTRRTEVHRILEGLHDWIDLDDLPDMLPGCERAVAGQEITVQEANVFNRCPYRDYCPSASAVELKR